MMENKEGMRKLEVYVSVELNDETNSANVYLGFPRLQEKLTIRETAHILASGLSMIIKSCGSDGNLKDFELMEEVISHINSEFASVSSFSDAKKNDNMFRDGDE